MKLGNLDGSTLGGREAEARGLQGRGTVVVVRWEGLIRISQS